MNIVQIFTTPIWESSYPEFNEHKDMFIEAANSFKEDHPEGVSKHNVNGYQSPMNLTKEPTFAPLFEFIAQMGRKAIFDLQLVQCDVYITAAWLNVHDNPSAMQYEHVHQDTFSGVFYLQVPQNSGKLVITNPGINPLWQGAMLTNKKNRFNSDRLKIEPVEGHVFLYPSYLPHGVEPNMHNESRISIGFNVIAVPKEHVDHTK
jgi:uncharacterized protein (TIGR02466 family)